jgi:hypothetical protein
MSYDIEIRSDDHYSSHAEFDHVAAFIAALPYITPNGSIGFLYEVDDHSYMEIDLELVDAEGDWLGDISPDTVNCIRAHIPYPYMLPGHNHPSTYFTICTTIARYLQWHAIDLQTDRDLLDGYDPSTTEGIVSRVLTTMQQYYFGTKEEKHE